jgi:hypothetical protein
MAGAMIASAVISAASAVFTGVQGYYQGEATEEAAEASAKKTEQESTAAANRIRARSRRLAATQRAKFAASGVDLADSVIDVQYDSAVQHEVDAMQQVYAGSIAASNLRTQGKSAMKAGQLGLVTAGAGAAGSILGGIGKYNAYKANPDFTGDKTGGTL